MNWKLMLFYSVVAPIAIVWDLLYSAVSLLHQGMGWIDKKGEELLDNLKQKCS
jgi:hypothetical protein